MKVDGLLALFAVHSAAGHNRLSSKASSETSVIWPAPKSIVYGDPVNQAILDPENFSYQCSSINGNEDSCDEIVVPALKRAKDAMFFFKGSVNHTGASLSRVEVLLYGSSQPLQFGVDESYELDVNATHVVVSANTAWGVRRPVGFYMICGICQLNLWHSVLQALHGIESFVGLVDVPSPQTQPAQVNALIQDFPVHLLVSAPLCVLFLMLIWCCYSRVHSTFCGTTYHLKLRMNLE